VKACRANAQEYYRKGSVTSLLQASMKTAAALLALLVVPTVAIPVEPKPGSTFGKVNNAPFSYKAGSADSIKNLKSKIKNVVWIILENRSFDNILGGVTRPGFDNPINNGPYCNPQNLANPGLDNWCPGAKDFDSILNDPDHSVTGNNLEFYGTYSPNNKAIANGSLLPSLEGFVNKQLISYPTLTPEFAAKQVMNYYSEAEIPTLVDIIDEFATFNYWHSCVPGVRFFE
jgi:phospholipase C